MLMAGGRELMAGESTNKPYMSFRINRIKIAAAFPYCRLARTTESTFSRNKVRLYRKPRWGPQGAAVGYRQRRVSGGQASSACPRPPLQIV